VEHYLSVLADKTGSLIATSGRFGAMQSGASDTEVDVLTRFGERIANAFQLSDDLLDVLSDSTESGKVPGTDLREGVPTLPVLLLRRSPGPGDERLLALLDRGLADDSDHAEALELLRAHPAVAEAQAEVRKWAQEARDVLTPLPEGPAKDALAGLCDQVVGRAV
jgi:heptaprenyl diphosphate synthase